MRRFTITDHQLEGSSSLGEADVRLRELGAQDKISSTQTCWYSFTSTILSKLARHNGIRFASKRSDHSGQQGQATSWDTIKDIDEEDLLNLSIKAQNQDRIAWVKNCGCYALEEIIIG